MTVVRTARWRYTQGRMSEFEGKTVLITGCARARGMGRASKTWEPVP